MLGNILDTFMDPPPKKRPETSGSGGSDPADAPASSERMPILAFLDKVGKLNAHLDSKRYS
jgi:hypothetical protein